ncbi:hypothetical protein GCM10012287_01910 [Streptomyces daqingensis]|uniref:Secreted protein n=1 Tax=Streptomyces daqingensis TaxID=1472640 RepID=A0ABQ2LQE0_9ACTN|nr:DUF6167 family protein [Streptomyces daqingensis]GGO42016.1 hypothetical protein GCM10012287_01910 [Streptomyces daqingensis]
MFRRAFWFTTGAAAGVWATTKVQRKLRSLAPDALAVRAADKAVDTGHRLKEFALDVRAGMAQRESELNDALGLDAPPDGESAGLLPGRPPGHQLGPAQQPGRTRPYDRNEDH